MATAKGRGFLLAALFDPVINRRDVKAFEAHSGRASLGPNCVF